MLIFYNEERRFPLFFVFYLFNSISLYICTVNPRENGLARESAFFALFLDCDLHTHKRKKEDEEENGCFHCYDCIPLYIHIRWSSPLFNISFFTGVQAQQSEIKISLGGSALLVNLYVSCLSRWGKQKLRPARTKG